jgi:multidrug efflux pump subunit AcrA (membrane-fusion protein)
LLYQIDPRPYQAAYNRAIGQLKVCQANQQYQGATFNRNAKLIKTGVISSEDYDQALSNKAQADAQLVADQASVESAKLNLDFIRVTSPIDGRVGRQLKCSERLTLDRLHYLGYMCYTMQYPSHRHHIRAQPGCLTASR